jgi:hypothetical protein
MPSQIATVVFERVRLSARWGIAVSVAVHLAIIGAIIDKQVSIERMPHSPQSIGCVFPPPPPALPAPKLPPEPSNDTCGYRATYLRPDGTAAVTPYVFAGSGVELAPAHHHPIAGRARFHICVRENGAIDDVYVLQNSGDDERDARIESALRAWHYKACSARERGPDIACTEVIVRASGPW